MINNKKYLSINMLFFLIFISNIATELYASENRSRATVVMMTRAQLQEAQRLAEEREAAHMLAQFQRARERARQSIQNEIVRLERSISQEQNDDVKKTLLTQLDQLKINLDGAQTR